MLAPIPLLASPASAATPSGGCWVWATAGYNISSMLAPWTDPGTSDHTITLSPADPQPGETVTMTYAFDKGPKSPLPATVKGSFDFDVNGTVVTLSKDFGIDQGRWDRSRHDPDHPVRGQGRRQRRHPGRCGVPGERCCGGRRDLLQRADQRHRGQESAHHPLKTNITATVTATGDPVDPTLTPSRGQSPSPGLAHGEPGSPSPTPSPRRARRPSASGAPETKGVPATGKTTFSCVLNPLGSEFDYPTTISVSGYRAKAGDPVTLQATMSDLPGIAPLPIDGMMNVTLGLEVDGAAVKLAGSGNVTAAPKEEVPVPTAVGLGGLRRGRDGCGGQDLHLRLPRHGHRRRVQGAGGGVAVRR